MKKVRFLIFGVVFLSIVFSASAAQLEADENTIALWHFNDSEGESLSDASSNNNDGVISGATWTDGIEGDGLQFSGEDAKVRLGDLDIENAFTIECWINPENIQEKSYILQKIGTGKNDNYALYIENGQIVFSCYDLKYNYSTQGKDSIQYTISGDLSGTNQWYYIAVEWSGWMDNSSLRLYVNGEQVNSEKMQFELSKNNDAAYIGWESSTGSFNGIIDEMRISDEPRGAAHYQNYYSGTTPVIERYRENRSPEKVNDIRTIGGKDIRIILPDIGGVANIGVTLHDFTGAMLLRSFIPSDDNGMIIVKNSRKLPVGKYIVRITNGDALYKVTSVIVR